MIRLTRYAEPLLLSAAMMVPLVGSGCAAHVRYYDQYHSDYHRWDDGEVRAYRVWLGDNHIEYREYNRLDKNRQADYWKWRHDHPGHY